MYAHCFIDNTDTGRIHLAYFTQAPFPGGPDNQPAIRWRSRGHHTAGAATQEGADQHLAELREGLGVETTTDLGRVEWDGTGVPALNLLSEIPAQAS